MHEKIAEAVQWKESATLLSEQILKPTLHNCRCMLQAENEFKCQVQVSKLWLIKN
jgi:hypothetical protein